MIKTTINQKCVINKYNTETLLKFTPTKNVIIESHVDDNFETLHRFTTMVASIGL